MIPPGLLPVPPDLAEQVPEASYARLLGYPDGSLAGGRVAALADECRAWFARHARPWGVAASSGPVTVTGPTISVADGSVLTSPVLAERCRAVRARELIVALVSAGSEVDRETARRWAADRPDEAYFLDRFGAAAAVHLSGWASRHLTVLVEGAGLGLAPGHSPGYDGWDLADQPRLALLLGAASAPLPRSFRVHESGMLEPRASLLAAFAAGADRAAAERLRARHGCSWCSLSGCALRGRPADRQTAARQESGSDRTIGG